MDRKKVLGEALRRLRKKADLSQQLAAENYKTAQGTWAKYEKGERSVILKEDMQQSLAEALGFTREDLLSEALAVEEGRPIFDAPNARPETAPASFFTPASSGIALDFQRLIDENARVMQIINEDVAPVYEPGQIVVYHLKRAPRLTQPVVIKMRGAGYIVRRYTRTSSSHIECYKYEARHENGETVFAEVREYIPLIEQEGVYPILMAVNA